MANVLFRRGTQAELQALVTASKIKDGAFYLTTDTHRLYSGSGAAKIDLLSQAVVTVKSITELNNSGAKVDGQFYYSVDENVLCIYSSAQNKYIQINPDSYTYVKSTDIVVAQVGTNGATLKNSVTMGGSGPACSSYDDQPVEDSTPVQLVGSGSVKVTVNADSGAPVITIDGIEYGIAVAAKDPSGGANLKVGEESINIVGAGDTTVSVKNGEVVIENHDVDSRIKDVSATALSTGGFEIVVEDQTSAADSAVINPIVKLGTNTDEYKFISGTATLPVYTKDEVDEKLNIANAMTYVGLVKGTSTNHSAPTSGVHVGDTYKVAGNYIDVTNGEGVSERAQVGDVIIARGTEYTLAEANNAGNKALAGTIKPDTLRYDVVHAADFVSGDRIYNLIANTTDNGFDLTKDGSSVNTVKFAGDSHIDVTAAATAQGASVTVAHKTITQNNPTNASAIVQAEGEPAEYEAIVKVNVDDAGHVTGVQKQKLTVVDTKLADGSATLTVETTNTQNVTNSVAAKTDFSVSDTAGTVVAKAETLTFNSPNNSIAISAGTKAVSFDLVWGTFADEAK